MNESLAQMNVRLNAERKTRGDEVLARFGFTPTAAVRSLWEYLATCKSLPEFMLAEADGAKIERPTSQSLAEAGAGMAIRLAHEAGLHCASLQQIPYEELREATYDERFNEWEQVIV